MVRPDAPAVFALASLFAALAALAYLLLGAPALHLAPGGLPGALGLDGLSAFLLLPFLAGAALPASWPQAARLAGGLLVLLADDGLTLVAGAGIAASGTLRPRAAIPVLLLLPALALLGAGDFSAIRAAPPETGRAVTALLLALPAAAGIGGSVGIYLTLRVALDLAGPLPPWAGLLPVLAGAVLCLHGSFAAQRVPAAPAFARIQLGMAMLAAGLALSARAEDLATLAGQALAGAWLAVAGGLALPLLGGAPVLRLAAALAIAAVPPGLGFAAIWTLLRVLQVAPPPGATSLGPLVHVVAALALTVAIGSSAAGALRLVRAALAERWTPPGPMLGLAALAVIAGVFPEAVLRLARPASVTLIGAPAALAPGYLAWAVAALLAAAATLAVLVRRRASAPGYRLARAWNDGAAHGLAVLPAPPPTRTRPRLSSWPLVLDRALRRARRRLPHGWPAHAILPAIVAVLLAVLTLAAVLGR